MSQGLFPRIANDLDLNGPILSFTNNPVGVATTSGASVTLSGFATATFVTTGTPDNAGSIAYQWYEVGVGALSDNTEFTGTGTTQLTISNLTTPIDNNRKFFLEADYNPAQGLTGNAINEPLNSGIGTITVIPNVEIVSQPSPIQVNRNAEATFTIDAGLTDSSFGDVTYQWVVDGESVSDGTVSKTTVSSTTVASTIDRTFTSDSSLDLRDATDVVVTVAGAAGGNGGNDANGAGGSGYTGRAGRFTYADGDRTLSFRIGRKGDDGGSGNQDAGGRGGSSPYAAGGDGGGAGQHGWSGGGGGGGGATSVFDSTVNRFTIVAAGGGGGGGGSWDRAARDAIPAGVGLGFGRARDAMSNSNSSPNPGNDGQTRNGDGGGGGGGGGGVSPSNEPLAGNGGADGIDKNFGGMGGNGGASGFDDRLSSFGFDGFGNSGNGYVNVRYTGLSQVDATVTRLTTISGSNTSTLKLESNQVGIQTVRCIVSSDLDSTLDLPFDNSDTNSPVLSDVVDFITTDATEQYNINIESIGDSTTASLNSINLANGEHEFAISEGDPSGSGRFTNLYIFYSPDKDIRVEMDLFGGKGANYAGNGGGEGGYARIRFTVLRNTEYVIAGLIESINCPFVYRKATLIACVGGGGDAGMRGRGGFGGGIGIAGQSGFGRGGGNGGRAITEGTSNLVARFGSKYDGRDLTGGLIDSDTQAPRPDGGDSIPCTKGVYWAQQGIAPCTDVVASGENFRLSDGSLVTNTSDSIARGYKAGYNAIQTAGGKLLNSEGGDGGNGITGGDGGNGGAGGGGSGYTNGEVTIIDNQLGGSDGVAKVIMRVVPPGPELVTFTQSRTSTENIQVVLTLESGEGPTTITLGSATGFTGDLPATVTAEIREGAIYNVTSTNNVDRTALNGNTATFSDIDSNPGSLSITPDKGRWDSTVRYQFL